MTAVFSYLLNRGSSVMAPSSSSVNCFHIFQFRLNAAFHAWQGAVLR